MDIHLLAKKSSFYNMLSKGLKITGNSSLNQYLMGMGLAVGLHLQFFMKPTVMIHWILAISLVLSPCYHTPVQASSCKQLIGKYSPAKIAKDLKRKLRKVRDNFGIPQSDEDIRKHLEVRPLHHRAFSWVSESTQFALGLSKEKCHIEKVKLKFECVIQGLALKNLSLQALKSSFQKIPSILKANAIPEGWQKMVGFSTFGIMGLMLAANSGFAAGTEEFSLTWVNASLGVLTGYLLGVGLIRTDDAVEEVQEAVALTYPTQKGRVEAIATNFPEGVMAAVFFVTTVAGCFTHGDWWLSLITASVTAAAVPIGSIWVNGGMRYGFSAIGNIIYRMTGKSSNGMSLFTDSIFKYAEFRYPQHIKRVKGSGKIFGPMSTPIIYSKSLVGFMGASLKKSQKSLLVFAMTLIPATIFFTQMYPMVMDASDGIEPLSMGKFFAWFAAYQVSVFAAIRINKELRGTMEHQIEIYGDEFPLEFANNGVEFLQHEINIASENDQPFLAESIRRLTSYIEFQAMAKVSIDELHRHTAAYSAMKLFESLDDLVENHEQRQELYRVVRQLDNILKNKPIDGELKEGVPVGHVQALITELFDFDLDHKIIKMTKEQKIKHLVGPLAQLSIATIILGIGTYTMTKSMDGVYPLVLAGISSFLSSAPEGFAMLKKQKKDDQLGADNVGVVSNIVNLGVGDTFFGGSTLFLNTATKSIKQSLLGDSKEKRD